MAYQNLFEALQNVCGFTALESEMFEIINAYEKDKLEKDMLYADSCMNEYLVGLLCTKTIPMPNPDSNSIAESIIEYLKSKENG